MKPQKAIHILERQRDKINDPKHPKNDTWKVQTASHIKDFFGENSDEYAHIRRFSFSVIGHTGMSTEQWRSEMLSNERNIVQFLDTCIETIKDKGLYKPPTSNFLSRLNDTWLGIIFGTAIPSLVLIGVFVGEYRADVKNFELRQELKSARDSLFLMTSTTKKNAHQNSAQLTSDKDTTYKQDLTHVTQVNGSTKK